MSRLWTHAGIIFSIAAAATATTAEDPPPASADLRPAFARHGLTAKAQGGRDTCSLFAVAGAAEFELAAAPGEPVRLSEEYLIWAANEAAGAAGDQAMFYEAARGLQTRGVCTAELLPYRGRPGKSAAPPAAARTDASARRGWDARWIKLWDVRGGLSPEGLTEVKRELANGHPVAAGLRWPKDVRLGAGRLIETPAPEGVFDGHSVLLVGYRDDPAVPGGGAVVFRNSVGGGWGDEGYAGLTYEYLLRYANDALTLRFRQAGDGEGVVFEAESLPVGATSRCRADAQDMAPFGAGLWGGGRQLYLGCGESGWAEVEFDCPRDGRYRLILHATCAPDFGRFRGSLDGQPAGDAFDLYSGRVSPAGTIDLGEAELKAGAHRLRLESAGRSPLSTGYAGGVDSVELRPAVAPDP